MALVDYYLTLFSHMLITLKNPEATAESLRQELLQELQTLQQPSLRHYSRQDIYAASSAVCICLDELILCSGHPMVGYWRNHLLQREIHNNSLGGMHFFQQLSEISDNNHELRIVYLFCLLMGYKGRYVIDEKKELERIIDQNIKKLPQEYIRCLIYNETDVWNTRPEMPRLKKNKPILTIFIILLASIVYLSMNLMLVF
ncbi:DotU family type IV/VI secretion system protein [Enterobacter ludwigii]|uniref:DotU family type IV/VI secretion system protein n=1 Tax=Enterobacter ludwigii TaxID=299767 RepID=UPI00397530CE